MARNWTVDQASTKLSDLLNAARESSQFIIVDDGRFEVSFNKNGTQALDDILDRGGQLEDGDIE